MIEQSSRVGTWAVPQAKRLQVMCLAQMVFRRDAPTTE